MTQITVPEAGHTIGIEREFDGPMALVWRCHTEPDLLARWLGPDRLSCRVDEQDLRHGGRYAFVNVEPDGTEHRFRGVYHGDPAPELTMRTFEWLGLPGHVSFETLRLTGLDGGARTLLTVSALFQTVQDRDGMAESMPSGVREGHRKLDGLLAQLS